ncbi:hypothetical protein Pla110_10560 [Polystyrenella longa]|uniref:Uncharacterized protein n=1 Tax=Polystyrenella longa TaxID=2528007 RepID=A0A518CJD7_9PLAN|nr:hypothetical protein [Polystyrenella longa]QDU79348.1 hypothetical protein Pla110_10560 [Polystyrenella longa]
MSRRRTTPEVEIGSDSFLDIIANIVGILIILIVIAAVRVSQSPIPTMSIESDASEPIAVADAEEPEAILEAETEPQPESEPVAEPVVAPTPKVIELDEQLLAEVEQLEAQLVDLTDQSTEQSAQIKALNAELQKRNEQTGSLNQQVQKLVQLKDHAEQMRAQLQHSHDKTKSRINQLTRVLEEVEQKESPTKELRHEVTPVSKRVAGKEIHFQVKYNKISVLPIDELVTEMKEEIPDNLSWIMKFNEYNGEVGPIRGFRMTYKVARESLSAVEQLQQGRGMMKVGVERWELVEDELLLAESFEKALEPLSSFQAALQQADSNSTLTFWVYPDSFATFQKIKEVVHHNGFLIAARPIPFGAPIAGSPNGSQSESQ